MVAAFALHGVSKRFGGVQALTDVDLIVQPGEIRGLIGPNGAGKTTVVNIATGVYAPNGGTVELAGEDVTRLPTYRRSRRGLIRTYQAARLFDQLTVLANVRVLLESSGAAAGKRDCLAVLEQTGLVAHASTPANDLPHGRRKILEVACAIHRNPKVLLLDEPAAGLGQSEIDMMLQLLRGQDEQVGVLIIEHNMELVMQLCDSITVINMGKPLAEGTPDEIASDQAVVSAYLGGDA